MAQINIKPNRIKFIKALEDAKKRIVQESEAYKVALKKYKADLEAWHKSADLSPNNIKSIKVIDTTYIKKVEVSLKKYPAGKPKEPALPRFSCTSFALDNINEVLVLLELTDAEYVSASVANQVAAYL